MRKKCRFFLFLLPVFLTFCQTINSSREELNIPVNVVYFSFDDGPNSHKDTTIRLLEVLKKYEIQAMFCLLGRNAEYHPDLVRRIYNDGHIIVNHGYSGKLASEMNDNEFLENLLRGEKAIWSVLDLDEPPYLLYRPHGGFYAGKQKEIARNAGYTMLQGTVRAYDAVVSGKEKDSVVKEIICKTIKRRGGIILLHDMRDSHIQQERGLAKNPEGVFNRSWIPDAVEDIVVTLLDMGFEIRNTSELADGIVRGAFIVDNS
jgi:peptidoglycan/xylan/chitin deacetylase (PgdA/CDA1 family)